MTGPYRNANARRLTGRRETTESAGTVPDEVGAVNIRVLQLLTLIARSLAESNALLRQLVERRT